MDFTKFKWTREPESYTITGDTVEIVTKPYLFFRWRQMKNISAL